MWQPSGSSTYSTVLVLLAGPVFVVKLNAYWYAQFLAAGEPPLDSLCRPVEKEYDVAFAGCRSITLALTRNTKPFQ